MTTSPPSPPPHPMWRRITDDYWVSEDGRIWSTIAGRVLRTKVSKTGYEVIVLKRLGTRSVHVLVAEAWLGARPSAAHVVDHIDGCKTNNHASNLEWVSKKTNTRRAFALGMVGGSGRNFVLTPEQVYQARTRVAAGIAIAAVATDFGVAPVTVRNAVYGLSYAGLTVVPPLALPREPGSWRPGAGGKRHEGPRTPVDGHPKDFITILPGEEWQRLRGSVSGYWISDQGRVFSAKSKKIKKSVVNTKQQNYWRVQLRSDNGGYEAFMLHRLVADYFLPPPPDPDYVVGHINEDPQDARAVNLAWISRSENAARAHVARTRSTGALAIHDFISAHVVAERGTKIATKAGVVALDVFIPDKKLGIIYETISATSELAGGRHRLARVQENNALLQEQGIRVVRVLSKEWEEQESLARSALLHKVGVTAQRVYARQTEVKLVPTQVSAAFLNANHMQGTVGSSFKYGCYFKGELVALATFGVPRYGNSAPGHYELLRYANKAGLSVVGGFSKIMARFIADQNPSKILSFADRRWSSGNLYEKAGFTLSRVSVPNYFYFQPSAPNDLRTRVAFQKHKLPALLERFDPALTEFENMKENGWDRIWDCGNLVYEMEMQ